MYDQRISRACLCVLLGLTAAAACDVEPDDLDDRVQSEAQRDEDEQSITPDDPPAVLVDEELAAPLVEGAQPVGFDTDGQVYLYDADGDSFPDLTERLGGSDVLDPQDPGTPEPLFPTASCRAGFVQAGSRLCISELVQNAARYRTAVRDCRNQRSQVCSYEDLTYLYYSTSLDSNYNPDGRWIGNLVADDNVLCGNRNITTDNDPDIANFEGTCSKDNQRNYWCCHDDE